MWLLFTDSFITTKMMLYIYLIINFLLCIASQTGLPTGTAMAAGSESDRLSLQDKLTNGVPKALPSWNDSVHFCKWQGVSCSLRHMRVSALYLTNQNLGGSLAPALGNLTFLKLLNLSYNGLRGQIPKQIGRLKRLQLLYLNNNFLEGELPTELANCSKLQEILFHRNNLTGKIPFWFGSMQQLTGLNLGGNQFLGTIPHSLGDLSSLEHLSLSFNNLEGSIPEFLSRLSNLYVLFLGANKFSGMIPPLYNLSRMENFDISLNYLSGAIPSNIDLAFPYLQEFNAGQNFLTGTIPSSLSNMSLLQIFDINQNNCSGSIPMSLGKLENLQELVIDVNNFGSGGDGDLDFLSSLTNCSHLHMLGLQGNNFGGVLPKSIGKFSSQLNMLSVERNSISGSLPEEIGQLVGLYDLILSENFFQGTIPSSIGKLINLGELLLENNQLTGNIPDVFGNLTVLFNLQLSNNNLEGTIPQSLKYCKGMQRLYLHQNNLSGNIPSEILAHQESLIFLDLSYNSLIGPLPSEIGNLKQLVELHLNENKLSGDIPMELGQCLGLTKLFMSANFFQGNIPPSFNSLKSLQSVDLSNNNLSGTIPRELKNLPIIITLNISYNHFHGEVPKGGVFDNITAISLTGNENLCGGIPQLKLPACPKMPKKHFKVVILIIVLSGALTCSAIFLIIYMRGKQKKLSSSPSFSQNTHLRVSYRELHDATNGFSSSNLIGMGSFGSVYRGTLHHFERPVAVKVLHIQTQGASKSFISECKVLSQVQHRNLLKILTSCSSIDYKGDDFKALVFEFMPNGSLENWISSINEHGEHRNLCLNFTQRLDIAINVAHALDYLHHDCEEAIVHCDIKPSNILLDEDMVAHLGDFGLARLLHNISIHNSRDQTTSSAIKGTTGYIPPEYGGSGQVTTQGDIYSYGVLLLEMLTGKKPIDGMFSEDLTLPKFCKLALPEGVIKIVDSTLLVLFDWDHRDNNRKSKVEATIQESLVSFVRIGVACCAELPSERMGIKDVLVELLAIKQRLSTLN